MIFCVKNLLSWKPPELLKTYMVPNILMSSGPLTIFQAKANQRFMRLCLIVEQLFTCSNQLALTQSSLWMLGLEKVLKKKWEMKLKCFLIWTQTIWISGWLALALLRNEFSQQSGRAANAWQKGCTTFNFFYECRKKLRCGLVQTIDKSDPSIYSTKGCLSPMTLTWDDSDLKAVLPLDARRGKRKANQTDARPSRNSKKAMSNSKKASVSSASNSDSDSDSKSDAEFLDEDNESADIIDESSSNSESESSSGSENDSSDESAGVCLAKDVIIQLDLDLKDSVPLFKRIAPPPRKLTGDLLYKVTEKSDNPGWFVAKCVASFNAL
eukprot:Pompholyxophrys_punicea_v1_NODE_876_length_1179_cov_2.399466.p1 type:complete len:325 gc:universal NODE_876_length_1179_cov_2.399466:97-1071(+)